MTYLFLNTHYRQQNIKTSAIPPTLAESRAWGKTSGKPAEKCDLPNKNAELS